MRGNPMSGEHLWPVWMHPHLPKIQNARNWTAIVSQTVNDIQTTRKKPQMGHVFTKKIKAVCKRCNETWMGDIEEDAKPILRPIIHGKPIVIDHTNQVKLATWIVLKFLVADHEKNATPISSKKFLSAFKEKREIPERIKIWIGYHNAFEWSAGYWSRGVTISFAPKAPTGRLRSNVKTVAFGAGHLFSLTFFSLLDRIDLEIDNPFTTKLWPNDSPTITWPSPLLPLNGIGALANILDQFEVRSDVQWGPQTRK